MPLSLLLALLFQAPSPAERPFAAGEGYASTPTQMNAVMEQSAGGPVPDAPSGDLPADPPTVLLCPHDDHAIAGPVYLSAMQRVRAHHLILIGVAHKAWRWNVQDVLIFDDFSAWNGSSGTMRVDPWLRGELVKGLAPDEVLVSNDHHLEEHSLAAFIPWIQRIDSGCKIVPILVPTMSWDRMEVLASNLAGSLAAVAARKNWVPGRDVQILISSDATHYGDQGWGGKNHAPYGTGCEGLAKATANDRRLIDAYLKGPIRPQRLKGLLYELVDEKDLTTYKVTWCGRFAIPFGLEFTRRLAEKLERPPPEGKLLAYSTSVELGQLEVKDLPPTAPANLRHWVGYAAMGWWAPEAGKR